MVKPGQKIRRIGAAAQRGRDLARTVQKVGPRSITPGKMRRLVILLDGPQDSIWSALVSLFAPGNPKNLEANLGMTAAQAITAIGKARYYWTKNQFRRVRAAYPALAATIAADMKNKNLATAIKKLLFFLEDIKAPKFTELEKYLTSADYSALDTVAAVARKAGQGIAAVADETKERGKTAAIETWDILKKGAGEIDKGLPWYFKPKVILPAAAALALLVYGGPLLSLIPKPKRRTEYKANPLKGAAAQAAETYQKFHDKKPAKKISIPKIETAELVDLGKGLEIGYRSKKWTGKPENYLHKFGPGVKLLATADGKSLIVTGGKLDLTPAGIVG